MTKVCPGTRHRAARPRRARGPKPGQPCPATRSETATRHDNSIAPTDIDQRIDADDDTPILRASDPDHPVGGNQASLTGPHSTGMPIGSVRELRHPPSTGAPIARGADACVVRWIDAWLVIEGLSGHRRLQSDGRSASCSAERRLPSMRLTVALRENRRARRIFSDCASRPSSTSWSRSAASRSRTTRPVLRNSMRAQRGTRRQFPTRRTGIPSVPSDASYRRASS